MNSTRKSSASEVTCIFENFNQFNFTIEPVTSSKVFVNHIAVSVVVTVLSVFIICLNSITAMAIWKSTELKKKTAHFLIMILSLNDLAVGIVYGPLYVATFAREFSLGKYSCLMSGLLVFIGLITIGCSFKTLLMMNVDRYLAIVYPIFHRTKVTKGRLVKCLVVLWLLTGALAVFAFYSSEHLEKFLFVEMLVCAAALVYIYVKIYLTSNRSFSNFRRKNRINASPQVQDTSQSAERKQHLRNMKLVKSCFIVVVCFCVCFLPTVVVNVNFPKGNEDIFMINAWLTTLLLSNSSLNSLIFFWRNKLLRKEAQRLIEQLLFII